MRLAWVLPLCLAGCQAAVVAPPGWESPRVELESVWKQRSALTSSCALLAAVDYQGPPRNRAFTLELFYRAPGQYLLRGRGTLGVEGFRARLHGDSLVLLLERQERGFAGSADSLPESARTLWQLLRPALPWVVGARDSLGQARIEYARGDRPARLEMVHDSTRLELTYARYREEYPFWHLRAAVGRSPEATVQLEIRQQLYNTPLDSALFDFDLPAGTQPLLD